MLSCHSCHEARSDGAPPSRGRRMPLGAGYVRGTRRGAIAKSALSPAASWQAAGAPLPFPARSAATPPRGALQTLPTASRARRIARPGTSVVAVGE
jgi:hypothetical protein